jgi:hypothetical protein
MLQDPSNIDSIVRTIQSSLAPVFLLSSEATLLGVLTTRLSRISDQVHALSDDRDPNAPVSDLLCRRLETLRRRTVILDIAVALNAIAGACTCGTAMTLFLGFLRDQATVKLLFTLFGGALACTIAALGAFLVEVLLSSGMTRRLVESNFD